MLIKWHFLFFAFLFRVCSLALSLYQSHGTGGLANLLHLQPAPAHLVTFTCASLDDENPSGGTLIESLVCSLLRSFWISPYTSAHLYWWRGKRCSPWLSPLIRCATSRADSILRTLAMGTCSPSSARLSPLPFAASS